MIIDRHRFDVALMRKNIDGHYRRSIRLRGHDYAMDGAYFVTICVQGRACLFGEVVGEKMLLNEAGTMIETAWRELPLRFPRIGVDSAIVMPNHFHGIVLVGAPLVGALCDRATEIPRCTAGCMGRMERMGRYRATTRVAPTSLGEVMGAFKSITTNTYIRGVRGSGWCSFDRRLWQRNYYEHVIRDQVSFDRIRRYIAGNPAGWRTDPDNPANLCAPLWPLVLPGGPAPDDTAISSGLGPDAMNRTR